MNTQKLYEFIDSSKDKMIELERILTSHKALAPENGGDGEWEKCMALEKWLCENGFKKNQLQHFDSPDERVSEKKRPNLVLTVPGKNADFSIWVMAHLDVVPAGDLSKWQTPPFEATVQDGKIFGRGTEDNQQGLVSAVFAVLSFLKCGEELEHTVKLLFVADEEVGSKYGVQYLVENTNIFQKNDIVLIPDGGDEKGETIEIAEKNLLWMKLVVTGKQTHGSRPDEGINACLVASDLSLRLYKLKNIFNAHDELFSPAYSTFEPTKRESNVSGVNIIPGEDVFFMDCRILPCYSLDEVIKKMREICDDVEKEYGVTVVFEAVQKSESPATRENAEVVVRLKNAIKKAHAIEAKTVGIGGGTVAAELRRIGIDCAVWSTLCDTAHTPNEYCIIENIAKDAKTLVEVFSAK